MSTKKNSKQIYHSQRIKEYPVAGVWECLTASRAIFREPGWEPAYDKVLPLSGHSEGPQAKASEHTMESAMRSIRRARVALRDYALSTEFRYFVTLTLDASRVDRFDMLQITKKMQAWCSNMVQRHGLTYVLVPELHKDGAVHFHGFFNDALPVTDSGTVVPPSGGKPKRPRSAAERTALIAAGGHIVYNLPAWTLGFTTALELYGEYSKAVGYCCKYIGKQQRDGEIPRKIGGRWYYSGGNLGKPTVRYGDAIAAEVAESEGAYVFEIPAARAVFVRETGNY
jgi:hypothetical protein